MGRLTTEQIVWTYRLLLGREPENEDIVEVWRKNCANTKDLAMEFILSEEFRSRYKEVVFSVESPDGFAIPTKRLINLIAGSSSIYWFFRSGILAQQAILKELEKNEIQFNDFNNVLDFGCGCGRVIRHWHSFKPSLYGTDYNPELVDWCRDNLAFGKFFTNDLEPPLGIQDAKFDFIYALSIFTHIPEKLQIPWLKEMKRLLRPNGYIFLSIHGDHYRDRLTKEEKKRYDRGEFITHQEGTAGSNRFNVFHPRQYIENVFSKMLKIVNITPEGALGNPHQDAILLQKKSNS